MKQSSLLLALTGIAIICCVTIGGYLVATSGKNLSSANGATVAGSLLGKFSLGKNQLEIGRPQNQAAVPLSAVRVTALTPGNASDSALYYEQDTGRAIEVAGDKRSEKIISNTQLPRFVTSVWSPTKQFVISSFATSQGLRYRWYDYSTQQSGALPATVRSVAFAPDGSRIAYFILGGNGESSVMVANPDGSDFHALFRTRSAVGSLIWPSDRMIALTIKSGQDYDLLALNLQGEVTKILGDQEDLETVWSPSGRRLLFSTINDQGVSELWYKDILTNGYRILSLRALASHCAWPLDETTVVCGTSDKGNGDKSDLHTVRPEVLHRISVGTGTDTVIVSEMEHGYLSVRAMVFSRNQSFLFITNAFDGKLYSIKTAP